MLSILIASQFPFRPSFRFLENPRREAGVRILYVSPLKALNEDIRRNLEVPLAGILERSRDCGPPLSPLQAAVRSGDTPAHDRARLVRKPPDILITGQNRHAIRLPRSLGSKLPSILIASRFPLPTVCSR